MTGTAGCTVPPPNKAAPAPGALAATQPPEGQEDLARFYEQKLDFTECGDAGESKASCAWLEVPMDYDKPDGETVKLRVLRVQARGGKAKKSLLVNPGGPGGSAVEYARAADFIVSPKIRRSFDVVGFDPRGVGESSPIVCVGPREVDAMIATDPTPDDAEELDALRANAEEFGKACQEKYPELLEHVSTVDAAKDMDVLRAALGQAKLSYLGKSYGTFLGATYAGLFPSRVGSMVLDGAIAPDLSNEEMNLGQAVGFETATRAYVRACISDGDCPLGNDVEEGMKQLRQLLKDIDERPLLVDEDVRVTKLTEGWASTGLARAMYEQELWGGLTDALREAKEGNGDLLFAMAREYADRDEQGKYAGNIMQVISAVNCLDRPATRPSDKELEARVEEFRKAAPTWGPSMALGSSTCETWPVKSPYKPEKITAAGAGPIVVVGTTRDPATPYEWAQRLADQLESGRLITFDGDGHTAYMRSNACVDNAVDAYLSSGKAPKDGLAC
ncbi:alpha/beta hydrolase [Gephyromycinifex aptenodytis]|uniref:alpha/beta hydrolase n=1 Tax=Gephyromycinifex aptenodytis TaxID=2716227 RepID=UPI001D00E0F4|nr:alpha/beta hydrolase [Gephyromycinifex aptenodytis]